MAILLSEQAAMAASMTAKMNILPLIVRFSNWVAPFFWIKLQYLTTR
jgi:hypothetical protein